MRGWEGGIGEWIRDDEVELLRVGEVADAGVRHVGGLVRRHYIIPATHCAPLLLPAPATGDAENWFARLVRRPASSGCNSLLTLCGQRR